jgi:uncharacterized protein YdeI (YjbR/CyaY-like superfamily)
MSPTRKTSPQKTSTKKAPVKKAPLKKDLTAKKAPAAKQGAAVTKGAAAADAPIVSFAQPRAWATWLESNHASSRGVWLKLAKKASGIASVTYQEALEVALAWGWIDGQKRSHDDSAWLQKFTPRGPRSIWSKINREKALALIAAGEMKPPGLEQVERARRDGRWEAAYDSPSRATVPDDLAAALAANARAAAFFATLNSANRYAILFRLQNSKKPETRARNIARFVEMLERNEKLHP